MTERQADTIARLETLFRQAILTDDFKQNPDVDPLTPGAVAGWLGMGSVFGDYALAWEIFDNFEHAQERAWELMDDWLDKKTSWPIYPLYAGQPIQIKQV
jgi:hypothetical protein